jgi:hypothetical protein
MFTHSQQNLVSAKKQIKILLLKKFDFVEQKHCAHYPGTKKNRNVRAFLAYWNEYIYQEKLRT